MADPGSVSYLFSRKGVVIVPKDGGCPRTTSSARCWTPAPRRSTTSARRSRSSARPTDVVAVRTALQDGRASTTSRPRPVPAEHEVPLDEDGARKMFKLIDALEDSDDVQNVFANFDVVRRGHGESTRRRVSALRRARRVAAAGRRAASDPNTCSDQAAPEGAARARARRRPRPDPVRGRRGRRARRATAEPGRRERRAHLRRRRPRRPPARASSGASRRGSTPRGPTSWRSSGSSPSTTSAP